VAEIELTDDECIVLNFFTEGQFVGSRRFTNYGCTRERFLNSTGRRRSTHHELTTHTAV
jgi:hypothetical protein